MPNNEDRETGDVSPLLREINIDEDDMIIEDDDQYVAVEAQSLKDRIKLLKIFKQ